MDRRDLLKFFAAGTLISPTGKPEVKAELIKTPEITLPAMTRLRNEEARITIETYGSSQTKMVFNVRDLSIENAYEIVDVTTHCGMNKDWLPVASGSTLLRAVII